MTGALRTVTWSARTTPLGLRFWDRTSGRIVGDGLEITAYPAAQPTLRATAIANTSGGWVLPALPLLGGDMRRADREDPWSPAPAQRAYRVEVVDAQRRFVPFSFPVRAPLQGFATWQCAGDTAPPPIGAIPLFSSPTRPTPITLAALRAELVDAATGAPAAWAVLEVDVPGQPALRGIADEAGRVAVLFAYPEASATGEGPELSPTGPADPPYTDQRWTLALRVRYTPRPPAAAPDLCTTLSQAPASLWSDSNRTAPLTSASLRYGRELIVRTTDSTSGRPMSVAFVTTP